MFLARKTYHQFALAAAAVLTSVSASATVVYNSWTVNEGTPANLSVTVTQVGDLFNWTLTVNPWNAEALGLFVDLGDVTMPASIPITNVVTSPTAGGGVSLVAKDTTSDSCGPGCNLNGSPAEPVASPDGQWELVFRLGEQGFQGYQTFSWTTDDFGLDESAFGLMAYRTQVNCPPGSTLPAGTNCSGSQKAYGSPQEVEEPPSEIPEPGTLALVGLAGLVAGMVRRRRA